MSEEPRLITAYRTPEPRKMRPGEQASIHLSVEFTISILKAGIAQAFIDYFTGEEKRRANVDDPEWDLDWEFNWYESSRADDAGPFDFNRCRVFHCDLLLIAVLRHDDMAHCASDMLMVHVYPNVPLQESAERIPQLLAVLGVTDWHTNDEYIDRAQAGLEALKSHE